MECSSSKGWKAYRVRIRENEMAFLGGAEKGGCAAKAIFVQRCLRCFAVKEIGDRESEMRVTVELA